MMIIIYFWLAAKTVADSYMRIKMRDLLVWALKLDPSLHQLFEVSVSLIHDAMTSFGLHK